MNRNMLRIAIIFCDITIIFCLLFCPNIYLKKKVETINVNTKYSDTGYVSRNIFSNTTDQVQEKNNIDTSKVGDYKITYTIKYLIFKVKRTKIIHVVDNEKPIITLTGNQEAIVCPNKEYIEEGYTVNDNLDKDLNKKVKFKKYKDKIVYQVTDTSNNEGITERKITYQDLEPPVITLTGYQEITLYVGDNYYESGYTAIDNCDGDLTANVSINNPIDSSTPGVYTITYTITDTNNNSSSVNRTVRVIRRPVYGTDGIIYLTFDDGPSSTITESILDILKEQNVKATFFVTSKSSSLDYLISREYNEGHTVGLHTSSHQYSYIYIHQVIIILLIYMQLEKE